MFIHGMTLTDTLKFLLINIFELFTAHFHLTKTIELSRVNLFNIITQYKATFAEDENSMLVSESQDTGNIFYTWLHEKVILFLFLNKIKLNKSDETLHFAHI